MRNYYVVVIVLLVSILFAENLSRIFLSFSDATESLEHSTSVYTSDNYIEKRERTVARWNWYVSIGRHWPFQLSVIAVLIISIIRKKLEINSLTDRVFPLAVYFTVLALITGGILEVNTNRFAKLSEFFVLLLLLGVWFNNKNNKIIKYMVWSFLFVFIFKTYLILNADVQTLGLLFFSNPLVVFVYNFIA